MFKFKPQIKICGITTVDQAIQIADLGVDAIGIICVKESPRYIPQETKMEIFQELAKYYPELKRVSVYKDSPLDIFSQINNYKFNENVIQLHGDENLDYCKKIKGLIPEIEIWKALRLKSNDQLKHIKSYENLVDAILLDAWNQEIYGGTGQKIKGIDFSRIKMTKPWWLAGGVSLDWIDEIMTTIKPNGIDISSGVEISAGVKDILKVRKLIEKVRG